MGNSVLSECACPPRSSCSWSDRGTSTERPLDPDRRGRCRALDGPRKSPHRRRLQGGLADDLDCLGIVHDRSLRRRCGDPRCECPERMGFPGRPRAADRADPVPLPHRLFEGIDTGGSSEPPVHPEATCAAKIGRWPREPAVARRGRS